MIKGILIVLLVSCSVGSKSNSVSMVQTSTDNYEVLSIDSINNYYVVYLLKDSLKYKIVSKKTGNFNCNPIAPNGKYDFRLSNAMIAYTNDSLRKAIPLIGVDCLGFENDTKICKDHSSGTIPALFYTSNLKGLCYVREN